jgi:glyoxylate reductase
MRSRIFVTQPIAASALDRLHAIADVDVNPDAGRILAKSKLCRAAATHDILFVLSHDVVDRDVIAANPKLKMIASMATTPDHIEIAEATAWRIPVTIVSADATEAIADFAFGLMLAVARCIPDGDRLVRAGSFPGAQSDYVLGRAVSGKTLGLIGCGRTGRAMARRARAFGMRIFYSDPRRVAPEDEQSLGLAQAHLDQLLGQSDFVSIHAPLNSETRHMLSERQFALMRGSSFLINTSAGAIVDEAALARALEFGRISGAALDVFEREPKIERALLTARNVVLTPHLGGATRELRETMSHNVVDNIVAVIEGRRPGNCVNPEVFAAIP